MINYIYLAVMLVITILAALTIPLVGDVMDKTRSSATKATLAKINEALQSQEDSFT